MQDQYENRVLKLGLVVLLQKGMLQKCLQGSKEGLQDVERNLKEDVQEQ